MDTPISVANPDERTAAPTLADRLRAARVELVALALLVGVTAATSLYTASRMFRYGPLDYLFHIDTAQLMAERGSIELPHFGYHLYVILLDALLPGLNDQGLATVSIVTLRAAAAVVIFLLLRGVVRKPLSYRAGLGLAAVSFALLVVTPITIPTWDEGRMYLGYIGMNTFHNPTIIMLVPLALALAWITTRITFSEPGRPGLARDAALAAVLLTLSTLVKPNYLLALLPAVGLLCLWRLLRGERLPWGALIGGLAVPGVIVLAWQYLYTYGGLSSSESLSEGSITFAPLKVMSLHSNGGIKEKFALSVAYPALVYGLYFPATWRDRFLTLAAAAFGVGACYTYLLAETDTRAFDGNFIWSAQITLLIGFVAATRFLVRRGDFFGRSVWTRLRGGVIGGAFALHLFSGVVFQAAGAPLMNDYKNAPQPGYDYAPPTLTSTLDPAIYDAYQTFRARQIRMYLTADSFEWGLLWVPEQAEPPRYPLIGAAGEQLAAKPDLPHGDRAAYFDLITLLHKRRYFAPAILTYEQGQALTRWQATGAPADLLAAGARYLLASDEWLAAQPDAVRAALRDPAQYDRLPVDGTLTLYRARTG